MHFCSSYLSYHVVMLTVISFTLHRMQRPTWPPTVLHMFPNKLTSTKLQNIFWISLSMSYHLFHLPYVPCLMTCVEYVRVDNPHERVASTPRHMFSPIDKHKNTARVNLCTCQSTLGMILWFAEYDWLHSSCCWIHVCIVYIVYSQVQGHVYLTS